MRHKTKILSLVFFAAMFWAGWQFGISPIRESLLTVEKQGKYLKEKTLRGIPLNIPAGYISENQYNTDIIHYDLNIDLYPEKKLLKGEAELTGVFLNKNVKELNLNFYDNLKILKVLLNNVPALYTNKDTRLSIPVNIAQGDTFKVKIIYEGTPKRTGLDAFVFGEINKQSLVYNLSEPTYASTWFPCNDIPSDKALLDIRITNDTSRISVSNGVLVDEKIDGSRKTAHWKTYYPISTYLICLYSSGYKNFSQKYISQDKADTMNIEYYVLPEHLKNAKNDFSEHPEMIDFFSRTFGEYPFIKEKYGVAEFLWQIGAMEHQTITGIGSNFVSGKNYYTDVYVHELSHHWWGDAVGPATWNDIWLNEGFATYSEALYFEHKSGKKALQSTMRSKFDTDFTGKISQPGEYLFSSTIYDKGAWVLHMLRKEIGDNSFFKLLRVYFEKYKYKTASTENFISLVENISGKNLNKFFDQWLNGTGIIDIRYDWKVSEDNGKYTIQLDIEQVQQGYETYNFTIDAELGYENKSNSSRKTFVVDSRKKSFEFTLDKKPVSLDLDPDGWLLADIKESLKVD